jgi:hypothetical protein
MTVVYAYLYTYHKVISHLLAKIAGLELAT